MFSVIFPGQGSQYVGMGQDLHQKFSLVREIFEKVDNKLNYSLSNIILNGPELDLRSTKNTQPAIMTIGVCIFEVLKKEFNLDLNKAEFFAGHSLGEYTALVCSGALKIENAAYLLSERGKAMQDSSPKDSGAMTAVIGMTITEIDKEIKLLKGEGVCEIANDNCYGQIVVSGTKSKIDNLNFNLKNKKKRSIVLPVSAPFHSSLMEPASKKMKDKIQNTNFLLPNPSIISNVTAKEENNVDKIKLLLVEQITSRVRWRESVEYMIQNGIKEFIEIGPGKILSGLIKKINKEVEIKSISTLDDIIKYYKKND